ncbi:MAG: hypothetical protein U1E19_07860 [Rhodoblastus sp.]
MGLSLRIPLGRGTLKIKSKSRVRPDEIKRKLPTLNLLGLYIIWDNGRSQNSNREAPPF